MASSEPKPSSPPLDEPEHFELPQRGLTIVSYGVTGLVLKASDQAVVKISLGEDNQAAIDIENKIYKRLGAHPFVTKHLHEHEGKVVLERLKYPLRKRLVDLSEAGKTPQHDDVRRWAEQLTEALQHAHSRGVMQVDIGPHNALLDWDDDVKLADFAGSSIDGSKPIIRPGTRFSSPNIPVPSIAAELFALGSTLYEVETTRPPYHGRSNSDAEKLLASGTFPDTGALMLREVIQKCWQSKYQSALEVLDDIKKIRPQEVVIK